MRLLVNHGHRRRAASPTRITRERAPELRTTPRSAPLEGRHDAQPLGSGRVPADPYAAWLQKREADQEAERLHMQTLRNPGAAWENLRAWDPSQAAGTHVGVGR